MLGDVLPRSEDITPHQHVSRANKTQNTEIESPARAETNGSTRNILAFFIPLDGALLILNCSLLRYKTIF